MRKGILCVTLLLLLYSCAKRSTPEGGEKDEIPPKVLSSKPENSSINFDEKNYPINHKPLDFSITKNVVSILFTAIIMLLLFKGLADSYRKNGMIAKGLGRFFEPLVLYIRDEIAIPNIGEKHYKRFMSYLLTLFFCYFIL